MFVFGHFPRSLLHPWEDRRVSRMQMFLSSHLCPLPRPHPDLALGYHTPLPILPRSPFQTLGRGEGLRWRSGGGPSAAVATSAGRMNSSVVSDDGVVAPGSDTMDRFLEVGNEAADAAGEVIRKYFRTKSFTVLDKDDLSPVTIADREAEAALVSIISESFPSHAIFGEENGWRCSEESADYVWVLDPIDGTKSFVTGKPLFGSLIALLHKGRPILGIIDQPILRERWIGMSGRATTLNGQEVSTRNCSEISQAYLYTTSPHLFDGEAQEAFSRVRNKVKVPLYGCDCYAYALLASGFVDIVVESGLKPYDFLAVVPVIEGAGGLITDWNGYKLHWEVTSGSQPTGFNVIAAGDSKVHQQALDLLRWQ